MGKDLLVRNRTGDTLLQEECSSKVENQEEKIIQAQKIGNDQIEEDIIIKCGLAEMVKCFFKEYVIVWHDPNVGSEENKQYIVQLEKFCEVYTFTAWEEASAYIASAKAACHVITSGTNGELLVKEICSSQGAFEIYVFCVDKDSHSSWAKQYEKVSCVETHIQNILDQIQLSLLKWYKEASSLKMNLPAFAPIFNDWDKSGMNNLHRYLKIIPKFKNRLQAKNDILALSRAIYSDKSNRSYMTEFDENYGEYNKEAILKWYTKESFLFKITNNCLRIANSDSIQYCRFVLKDLEQAIKEEYREKSKTFSGLLYRGASLCDEEWLNLKSNLNGEIEIHGFLSASKDKDQALKFIEFDSSKNLLITIIVPKGPNDDEQGFAEVEEFSKYPKEKEVLFNVRSRFTVLETEDQYCENLPYRHLVLLYGAQGFRKFVTEENPVHEVFIPNTKEILCCICQGKVFNGQLFIPINMDEVQSYFCKRCFTSDIPKAQNSPFLCVPMIDEENQIKLKGVLMKETTQIPMYGYECKKCRAKKQEMYYQCTECGSERREVWCENCIHYLSECTQKGHHIIVEGNPFSFWCEKMSEKELDHLKFQNNILEYFDEEQQAEMHAESQEYRKAIEYHKISIAKSREKKKENNLALAYDNLAFAYYHQAEYHKALEHYSQALTIYKALDGSNYPYLPNCYMNMGNVYSQQAEHQKALEYYSHALEIWKSLFGNNNPLVSDCYINIGNVYCDQAEYQKALEYHSQALAISKAFYGNHHPDVAICYNNMGNVYYQQAEYQKALEHHSQALKIKKLLYGDNHQLVATSLGNTGHIYWIQGEYKKALVYFSQALEIVKSFCGNNHPLAANNYNRMGQFYIRQAKYSKALENYFKGVAICKSIYGDNHPHMADSLTGLGKTHFFLGDHNKALEYYFKSLEMKKLFFHEHHPYLATIYCNIGYAYNELKEQNKALEYHSKALEIRNQAFRENHADIAESYSGLGRVYFSLREYEKSLEYHLRSLEIRKLVFHEGHPDVADCYHDIANILKNQGKQKEALEYYSKSWKIRKQVLRENHPDTIAVYNEIQIFSKYFENERGSNGFKDFED